jgi:hypothetical protein
LHLKSNFLPSLAPCDVLNQAGLNTSVLLGRIGGEHEMPNERKITVSADKTKMRVYEDYESWQLRDPD